MGDVIDIEESMPHFCITGPLNEPHVIPVEALIRMANGKNKLINEGQEREDIDLIRGIIFDWLATKGIDL